MNQVVCLFNTAEDRWKSSVPLACALLGALCFIVAGSTPRTHGLSGEAFMDAFEANEDVMFLPIAGFPLAVFGLAVGLTYYRRTWNGKIAATVALLSVVWFCWRQSLM